MRPGLWLGALWRAPWRRRFLALEAAAELARARILTLGPARVYSAALGQRDGPAPTPPEGTQTALAGEIGTLVTNVAAAMPFRALCLEQVLATRRMLTRRGCAGVAVLGVRTGSDLPDGFGAHAWFCVGDEVVSGDGDIEQFSVIGRFS
ncbi:MAG: lasso peptide biosynthesis B2 protein [Pseudomonadota bacterium]